MSENISAGSRKADPDERRPLDTRPNSIWRIGRPGLLLLGSFTGGTNIEVGVAVDPEREAENGGSAKFGVLVTRIAPSGNGA